MGNKPTKEMIMIMEEERRNQQQFLGGLPAAPPAHHHHHHLHMPRVSLLSSSSERPFGGSTTNSWPPLPPSHHHAHPPHPFFPLPPPDQKILKKLEKRHRKLLKHMAAKGMPIPWPGTAPPPPHPALLLAAPPPPHAAQHHQFMAGRAHSMDDLRSAPLHRRRSIDADDHWRANAPMADLLRRVDPPSARDNASSIASRPVSSTGSSRLRQQQQQQQHSTPPSSRENNNRSTVESRPSAAATNEESDLFWTARHAGQQQQQQQQQSAVDDNSTSSALVLLNCRLLAHNKNAANDSNATDIPFSSSTPQLLPRVHSSSSLCRRQRDDMVDFSWVKDEERRMSCFDNGHDADDDEEDSYAVQFFGRRGVVRTGGNTLRRELGSTQPPDNWHRSLDRERPLPVPLPPADYSPTSSHDLQLHRSPLHHRPPSSNMQWRQSLAC